MPTILTGITGRAGGSTAANRNERTANLADQISQNLDSDGAKGILTQLRGDIANRSGYLRLDGGGQGREVGFSSRWSLNPFRSAKGEVTGAALKALFEKGGYDTNELDAYLGARRNNPLALGDVRRLIDNASQAAAFRDAQTANGAQIQAPDTGSKLCAEKMQFLSGDGEEDLARSVSAKKAIEITMEGLESIFPEGGKPAELASGNQGTVYSVGGDRVYKKIILNQEITIPFVGDLAASKLKESANVAVPTDFFIQVVRDGASNVVKVPANGVQEWCRTLVGMGADLKMVGTLMPKAPGETVEKKMKDGIFKTDPGAFQSLAKGLVGGLQEMHKNNLVYHDLKPANILMDTDSGRVTFVDLGEIVELTDSDPTTSKRAGSELMMEPRVKQREPHGTEVDYYSLAVTLLASLEPELEKVPPGKVSTNGRAEDLVGNHIQALKGINPEKGEALELELANNNFAKELISKCFVASSESPLLSGPAKLSVQQMVAA